MNPIEGKEFKSIKRSPPDVHRKGISREKNPFDALSVEAKVFLSTIFLGSIFLYIYLFMKNMPHSVYLAIIPPLILTGSLPAVYLSKNLQRVSPLWRSYLSSFLSAVIVLLDILFLSDIFGSGHLFNITDPMKYVIHFIILLFLSGFGVAILMMAITENELEKG